MLVRPGVKHVTATHLLTHAAFVGVLGVFWGTNVYLYMCVCWWVWGRRGAGWLWPRPSHLSTPPSVWHVVHFPPLLRWEKAPPHHSLRKWLFWKVSDVNESSRTRSQGCKQRADEVSRLFMHCCHPLEGWPLSQATRELPGLSGPDTAALPRGASLPSLLLLFHLHSLLSSISVHHVCEEFHNA